MIKIPNSQCYEEGQGDKMEEREIIYFKIISKYQFFSASRG